MEDWYLVLLIRRSKYMNNVSSKINKVNKVNKVRINFTLLRKRLTQFAKD